MKTRIKSFVAGLVIFIMTTVAGISQEITIDLKSDETQQQVFTQILNDNELLTSFIKQLHANENAMNTVMSKMMMQCCTDSSICKNLTEQISEHDEILEQLGKVLLEKENSNYSVQPRPRHEYK